MSHAARTAPIRRLPTTPAATGTARSARAPPRSNGSPRARPTCCRCRTITWCSRCLRRSPRSPTRTRPHLRPAVQGFGRDAGHDRGRPQALGRPRRRHLGPPYMGLGAHPSSARPYDRTGRRHLARRQKLDILPTWLLPPRPRAVTPVPAAVPGEADRGPQSRPSEVLRQSCRSRRHAGVCGLSAPLQRTEWVVYAKRPFGGPQAVLAYLSRYTHRVAIANSRLIACDRSGVTFRWKDYRADDHDRQKVMTLATAEFIRRFLTHVLP